MTILSYISLALMIIQFFVSLNTKVTLMKIIIFLEVVYFAIRCGFHLGGIEQWSFGMLLLQIFIIVIWCWSLKMNLKLLNNDKEDKESL